MKLARLSLPTTLALLGLWTLMMFAVALFVGCAKEDPAPPPVPHAPEDLSHWSVPELVQPPPPPAPVPTLPQPSKPTAAEKVFDYAPGETYAVTVSTSAPLDVVLERGEQVRNIVGGDRAPVDGTQTPRVETKDGQSQQGQSTRWEIREGASGLGDTLRQHVFVSASQPGLTTGFILTTTKRAYYLSCKSVAKSPVRVVRWHYPVDVDVPLAKPKEPGLLPDPDQPKRWHVGYDLQSVHTQVPEWSPRGIYDDGKKMYIVYPEIALFETVPVVRMVGPNGPALVNARQFLNVLIVDQLAPRLELRVGLGEHAEVMTVARGELKTIACPGDELCPVFPRAAQALARKSPPGQPPVAMPPPTPPKPPAPPPPAGPAPLPRGLAPQTGEFEVPDPALPLAQGALP
jgi:type IV secretory pathway VirB9-like protein